MKRSPSMELSRRNRRLTYVLTKYIQPTQTFVTGEIAEMRRQGVEVDVIAMERGELSPSPGENVLFLDGPPPSRSVLLRQHLAAFGRRPRGYLAFLLDVRRLGREVGRLPEQVPWTLLPGVSTRIKGEALHAHFAWSGAAAALLLSRLTGLPWSVTLHANDIFNRQRNLELKLASADQLVTVCDYNIRWLREHFDLKRSVSVVVCGVDLPDVPWPRIEGADVVAVNRLVEKKGVDVLLRAAALLLACRPTLRIDVIGSGALRQELEQLAEDLGLADCVRFLGALPHEEALARIAGARVFCLPARIADDGDRDSMPVVIKEAMARLVPVVASDVAAISEMLGDDCGIMVPPNDPMALASALAGVLDGPDRAARMVGRARTRVENQFTLAGETARLRALLLGDSR